MEVSDSCDRYKKNTQTTSRDKNIQTTSSSETKKCVGISFTVVLFSMHWNMACKVFICPGHFWIFLVWVIMIMLICYIVIVVSTVYLILLAWCNSLKDCVTWNNKTTHFTGNKRYRHNLCHHYSITKDDKSIEFTGNEKKSHEICHFSFIPDDKKKTPKTNDQIYIHSCPMPSENFIKNKHEP